MVLALLLMTPLSDLFAFDSANANAVKGVVDLSSWNFEKDGPVKLNGQWEFYWKKLLTPKDFSSKIKLQPSGFMTLPSVWNGYRLNGRELPGQGHATFRLKIILPPGIKKTAFSIRQQETAYEFWADSTMLFANGTVGISRNKMMPLYQPRTASYRPESKTLLLTIRISNYFHKKGGLRNSIEMGTEQQTWSRREQIRAFELFLFGSLLIMAFYHFGLFWFRKNDKSTLLFAAVCFFFALRVIFDNNFLLEFAPNLSWGFLYKMYYLSGYLTLPFFVSFIHRLYPQEFPKLLLRIIQWTAAVYIGIVILTPALIYTYTAVSYQIIILFSLLYVFMALFVAAFRKREGAVIFLAGYFFLFGAMILFLLDDNGIIDSYDYMPLGIFGFILAQSILLSMRLTNVFSVIETQSKELHEVQNYLNNVINSMPSIIIGLDNEGKITHWNNQAEETTGVTASQAMKLSLENVFPELNADILYTSKNFTDTAPVKFEKIKVTLHNETNIYNIILYPLITEGIDGTVLRIDNISELEKKEAQLRQAQKMEIVGTLAGGLAHDFNNVLTGIFGTITILKHKFTKNEKLETEKIISYLNLMEDSSVRARDMVTQLLTLSRKQDLNLLPVDCNQIATTILKICENSFDKSIKIKSRHFPKPAMVIADGPQIEQVLLNLCVNASHAMTVMRNKNEPWGGELEISVEKIYADRHFCNTHAEATKAYYHLISVKDTGVGMDNDTISKIFTPFYTTKEKEKGTGLGLSMVYNIINQHRGFIDVYSEVGIGSHFSLYLPVAERAHNDDRPANEVIKNICRGEGKILIIDDEEIMRTTSSDILLECGYEPISLETGRAALEYFKKHHHEIKGILLDMVMPEISGKEVYIKLKNIDPSVRVLLSSGFRHDKRIKEIMDLGVQGFIQKPYSLDTLGRAMYNIFNTDK